MQAVGEEARQLAGAALYRQIEQGMKQAGPEGAEHLLVLSEEGEASKLGDGNVDEQNRKRDEMQKDDNCGHIRKKLDHA